MSISFSKLSYILFACMYGYSIFLIYFKSSVSQSHDKISFINTHCDDKWYVQELLKAYLYDAVILAIVLENFRVIMEFPELHDSFQVVLGFLGWKPIWKPLNENQLCIREAAIVNKTTRKSKGYLLLWDRFDIFYLLFPSKFDCLILG